MKNSGKLLLVLLLVLSVLITSVPCNAQAPAQAAEAQAAEAQAAQEKWIAVVTSAQGGVYVQHSGQTQWEPLKVGDKCNPGDSIRVEENSRAALLFKNDSTLRIDQNTSLTFQPMEEQTVIMRLFNGAACFFSRIPRSLKIFTPHMNGTVKGTEFVIRVDGDQTQLTLYEGQVLAENEKGELLLAGGQSVVAKKDQAPALVTVVRPRDAVQWALYYPPIQDFSAGDFPGEADWQSRTRTSVEAWRRGDLTGAAGIMKGIRDEGISDTRYLLYRASLALTVGRADEATAYLERTLRADPKNADAYALQSIIATTQSNKAAALDLATRAVSLDPQSSAARIALSYAQQARFDLNGAMVSTQDAVKLNPSNAYARARLAELWLSQGYLNKALEEAEGAVRINPNISRTQTVLGFAHLTQVKIPESRAAFEKAIALDSADPLPRLGLGLAKIRKGGLEQGRQEIEIAASLDVNNSLIRSYLGKAYYEEKRESLSTSQFNTAKQLDPLDPTPWFYDAILKQSVNRPVEALEDMQKSIELNDNRAVYRSKLLLDQDLAARSASQARIYGDLGFQQLALVEGWKSVNTDPTNFSAHRLLADSYASRPRHEVARVSELLQSQLLQPININPVQASLAEAKLRIPEGSGPTSPSFNEYNPLFNRDRFALQASGAAGDNNTAGDSLTHNAVIGPFSYSLGQFYYQTDGFRTNNYQDREIYNAFGQWMLNYKTSIQAEVRYSDYKYGDLALRFDPKSYDSSVRFTDRYSTVRAGLRHAFTPDSDFIVSGIYSKQNGSLNAFEDMFHTDFDNSANQLEAQYIFRSEYFRLIAGGGYVDVNEESKESLYFPGFPAIDGYYHYDTHHTNVYAYTYTTYPRSVTWTLGVSADFYGATYQDGRDQVNPKLGVTWTPWDSTTFRAAAFRTLKRDLITQQTIEPTQVAGFNQFFDDLNGTDTWRYGVAVDQKIMKNLFAGLELSKRDLERSIGSGEGTWKAHEEQARAYLYWAFHPWFAFSAEWEYNRQEVDPAYAMDDATTKIHNNLFPLALNFFHPSGIVAQFKATYVDHESDSWDTAMTQITPGSDHFWVCDASVGYRLPKRYGMIVFEVKNLFNESIQFVDIDKFMPRIYPDRFMLGRVILSF